MDNLSETKRASSMSARKQGETPADEGGSGTKPPRIKISKSSDAGDAKVVLILLFSYLIFWLSWKVAIVDTYQTYPFSVTDF